MTRDARSADSAATVAQARWIAGASVVIVLVAAVLAVSFDLSIGFSRLTSPAALLGLFAPVLGYRLHVRLRSAAPKADPTRRENRYLRSILLPLALTEAAALLGVVSFALGGGIFSLVGVLSHGLLAGALWPADQAHGAQGPSGPADLP